MFTAYKFVRGDRVRGTGGDALSASEQEARDEIISGRRELIRMLGAAEIALLLEQDPAWRLPDWAVTPGAAGAVAYRMRAAERFRTAACRERLAGEALVLGSRSELRRERMVLA